MDCKVILNINGIETTSRIYLEDGFDKNDAVIQIKKRLQQLLDNETIEILEDYSMEKDGTKNVSSAIRSMARDHSKMNYEIRIKTAGDK